MIRVELTKDHGGYAKGEHIVVDSNSARALIDRGDAKKVKVVETVPVESGAARARELQAAADADQPPADAPADTDKGTTEGKK